MEYQSAGMKSKRNKMKEETFTQISMLKAAISSCIFDDSKQESFPLSLVFDKGLGKRKYKITIEVDDPEFFIDEAG